VLKKRKKEGGEGGRTEMEGKILTEYYFMQKKGEINEKQ